MLLKQRWRDWGSCNQQRNPVIISGQRWSEKEELVA
jgi:hypothetical protein